jgi:hypothetical protein
VKFSRCEGTHSERQGRLLQKEETFSDNVGHAIEAIANALCLANRMETLDIFSKS